MARAVASSVDQRLPVDDALLRALTQAQETTDPLVEAMRWDAVAAMATARKLAAIAAVTEAIEVDPDHTRPSVAEQLHATNRRSRASAYADVKLAERLQHRFPVLLNALHDGVISPDQTRAIVHGLRDLPSWLSVDEMAAHQHEMVALAANHDPHELRVLAQHLVEAIDPAGAEEAESRRLERDLRRALRNRYLTLNPDHHGSMIIKGSLPIAEGDLLKAQLDALLPAAASYQHEEEGLPTQSARRADALVRLLQLVAATGDLPAHGGDRPHVSVTVSLETLRSGLGVARLVGTGEELSAAEARHLACDAQLLPAVMGRTSQPLDLGRSQRLFTGALRTALVLRDQGCAFPGCDATPAMCDGHHIVPWHAEERGETSLSNGVLVCKHHHRMVEPDPRRRPEHQWTIYLDDHDRPVFVPPLQVDIRRRPRQHHRYRLGTRDPA